MGKYKTFEVDRGDSWDALEYIYKKAPRGWYMFIAPYSKFKYRFFVVKPGFVIENSSSPFTVDGYNVSREEFKAELELRRTPLWRAIYE